MIQIGVRHQARNEAGDPIRNKAGQLVFDRPEGGLAFDIQHGAMMLVRVESQQVLEGVRSQFERLANAMGVKLDIGVGNTPLTTAHDPDPVITNHEPVADETDGDDINKMQRVDASTAPVSVAVSHAPLSVAATTAAVSAAPNAETHTAN